MPPVPPQRQPKLTAVRADHFFPELPFDDPLLRTPAVWHDTAPRTSWVRVLGRRTFHLSHAGAARLRFSGSMRCELFLDGELLSRGPGRGDPFRWSVVSCDLGVLDAGPHELTCRISHFGGRDSAPCGQMGPPAFFLLRGEGVLEGRVDSGPAWEFAWDQGAAARPGSAWAGSRSAYFPMGCGEDVLLSALPTDAWRPAISLSEAAAERWGNLPLGTRLRDEALPARLEEAWPWKRLVETGGLPGAKAWAEESGDLHVPPHQCLRLVLDAGTIVNAWPRVRPRGGMGSRIRLTWSEAPRDTNGTKVHRDDAEGRLFPGFRDLLTLGECPGEWQPGWLRSFRYLEVEITTVDQPLVLEPVRLRRSHLPMCPASIELHGPGAEDWQRVYEACWKTIDACAHESVWDCPVHEQCQFSGDTRFQVLWHYACCGFDHSARLAIDDQHASRLPDGIQQCRWPSNRDQILPTYALHWVQMLGEFLRWRGQAEALSVYLHGARETVCWFLRRQRQDGLLHNIPYAPFVDWAPAFEPFGNAPQAEDGGSAILVCMLIQSLDVLARLETVCGWPELAPRWQQTADHLRHAVRDLCWDEARGLLAETPDRDRFSLHTQVEAANAGVLEPNVALACIDRARSAADVSQPGTFFYIGQLLMAQARLGAGERIHAHLNDWLACLDATGLTTLPETMAPHPRSDCHAWSASPGLELVTSVLGVQPAPDAVGYDRLIWQPHLGTLERAAATLPHPLGQLHVTLERRGARVHGRLESPVPVRANGRDFPAGSVELDWPG